MSLDAPGSTRRAAGRKVPEGCRAGQPAVTPLRRGRSLCTRSDNASASIQLHFLPGFDDQESGPGDRFDLIWRFDLDEQTGIWTFGSLDQQLLRGR
jgi:hypothetical protein